MVVLFLIDNLKREKRQKCIRKFDPFLHCQLLKISIIILHYILLYIITLFYRYSRYCKLQGSDETVLFGS